MDETVSRLEVEEYHALKVKEILEHILEYCTLRDLKQCRLVSTFWRDSSVKSFKSFPVKLTSSTKTKQFVRILKDPRPAAGTRAQLYASFHFVGSSLSLAESQLAPLWTIIGSHIKHLELSDIPFLTLENFRTIVLNHCSNMKELTLRKVMLASIDTTSPVIVQPKEWQAPQFGENKAVEKLTINQTPGSLCISWMELVNYFPSLKILRVEETDHFHQSLLDALKITREHDPNKLVLNEIHFSFSRGMISRMEYLDYQNLWTSKVNYLLGKTNLQLRALSIDLSGGLAHYNALMLGDILESQGRSLKRLTIRRKIGRELDPIVLHLRYSHVLLENLEELELESPVFTFTTMWFLKMMPNLKKLSFSQTNFSSHLDFSMETDLRGLLGVQLLNCVELKVNCDLSLEELKYLFNLFPNVKRLTIFLDDVMFKWVCREWPNLVELNVVHSEVGDCGITGLDERDVLNINALGGKFKWRPITVPRANITDLKHLRKFSVTADRSLVPYSFLGYCAKLYGFEKMANLEDLSINNYILEKKAYKKIFIGNRKVNLCTS